MRDRAEQHAIPILSLATQEFLQGIVDVSRPRRVAEIGSAIGYSTHLLAHWIGAWEGNIASFEISAPSYHAALYYRERLQIRNSSLYHLDVLAVDLSALNVAILDMVFVDGMKTQYSAYLHTIRPYCAPGCIVICDDVVSQQDKMELLWSYLDQEQLTYEIIPLRDQDGVAVVRL